MTGARRQSVRARGFALPMVLLVAMVGTIAVSAMLTRYGSQNRSVHRHTQRYVEHHMQRGVQEVVGAWLESMYGGPLAEVIGPDGLALVVDFEGGRRMEVYLRDGQGTLLTRLDEAPVRERQTTEAALVELTATVGAGEMEGYTRSAGPVKLSVAAVPGPVLRAILVSGGVSERTADRIVGEVVARRERGPITYQEVFKLLDSPGSPVEGRAGIAAMLTDSPILWLVETRIIEGPRDRVLARYAGLVEVETRRGGRGGAQATFKPAGPFLTWEVLDVN